MNKLETIVKALDDRLAENIVAIDMSQASPIFDTFVLCTASNQRLMQAICDRVEEQCAKEGYFVQHIEGLRDSKWLLMDFGDIIVHIFEGDERRAYNLEKLWADMPRIEIEDFLS